MNAHPAPQDVPILKTPEEIGIMREAGRIVARAHQAMREAVRPGISTAALDRIAETVLRDHGAVPVFKGYPKPNSPDFPAAITASINDELVHGIPSEARILREGDLLSLDCGCIYNGFVGDAAFSMGVGEVRPAIQRLMDVTERALALAIEASVLGNETADVAFAVQRFVLGQGYSVAREYTGHGVGRSMHEEPQVPNWWPRTKRHNLNSFPLAVGMTYAIEPMVIAGRPDLYEKDDHWTVATKDGSWCAHFEHTIAITEGQPIILTLL